MKKTVLILLSITFFLRPIYSCSFPSQSLVSIYNKINQPLYRISLGVTSMILLQLFNKKSIPGLRIPQYIKDIANNIKEKEQNRKTEKIIHLFKECDFMSAAIATFNKYGSGDAFAGKRNNLFTLYNALIAGEGNQLKEKIKNLYDKKTKLGNLNFKNEERIAPLDNDFLAKANTIENCAIDEYLEKLLETIDQEEQLQNNFFYKLFFKDFTEKIKFLLILGELQLILYCLPFIYNELNKTVED